MLLDVGKQPTSRFAFSPTVRGAVGVTRRIDKQTGRQTDACELIVNFCTGGKKRFMLKLQRSSYSFSNFGTDLGVSLTFG